jgi:hypothetical protein
MQAAQCVLHTTLLFSHVGTHPPTHSLALRQAVSSLPTSEAHAAALAQVSSLEGRLEEVQRSQVRPGGG